MRPLLSAELRALPRLLTTSELRRSGMSKRRIAAAVDAGELLRVRLGRYLPSTAPEVLVEAACLGGRLDCVSLLTAMGVFVHRRTGPHLQFAPHATRLPPRPQGVRAHWRASRAAAGSLTVDPVEALVQSVRCQGSRAAIATLDSAWHLGVIEHGDVAEIFRRLPRRYQVLQSLLDPRAEAGTESLVRLILRTIGYPYELQVRIDGVGRVDFLVDGWLIIECDSREFHSSWEAHEKDRRRDTAALERGYVTVRLLATDILNRPDVVRTQLQRIMESAHGPRAGKTRRPRASRGT